MRFNELIQALEDKPGIYMMLSKKKPIYIGKAKSLKNRLKQYFQNKANSHRIQVMVSLVDDLEVIVTESEAEALILENKLIKEHQPKYNIMLKDDKSFPYLMFTKHDFPRLQVVRVKKTDKKGRYYGPYVNQKQASLLLEQMQKIFQIRNCSDHFYRNRMRPCMQYEIGRCKAPCVGYIDKAEYKKDIDNSMKFLEGKSEHQAILLDKMYKYSENNEFEQAAYCRDLLQSLGSSTKLRHNHFDVFYVDLLGSQVGIVLMSIVDDKMINVHVELIDVQNKYFSDDWIEQYVYQHYLQFEKPKVVVLPKKSNSLEEGLGIKVYSLEEKKYQKWNKVAKDNLMAYRQSQSSDSFDWPDFWLKLEGFLDKKVDSILCLDVSHNQGSSAYASCVVALAEGMQKSGYRAYKVNSGNDDYASMKEVLNKIKKERLSEGTLLIIDGGKGQINTAYKVLEERGLKCILTSISKGKERVWGDEKFYRMNPKLEAFSWPDPLLKYILHIRDEAHDFAIRTHRRALRKLSLQSILDTVSGIGKDRKKLLLGYFGGLEGLKCAKLDDIAKVPGIGPELAKRIYKALHVDD